MWKFINHTFESFFKGEWEGVGGGTWSKEKLPPPLKSTSIVYAEEPISFHRERERSSRG